MKAINDAEEAAEEAGRPEGEYLAKSIRALAHPAQPADALEKRAIAAETVLKELRLVVPYFWNDENPHIGLLDAAVEKADAILTVRRLGGMASEPPPLPEIESEYEHGFRIALESAAKEVCEQCMEERDVFLFDGDWCHGSPKLPHTTRLCAANKIRALRPSEDA